MWDDYVQLYPYDDYPGGFENYRRMRLHYRILTPSDVDLFLMIGEIKSKLSDAAGIPRSVLFPEHDEDGGEY